MRFTDKKWKFFSVLLFLLLFAESVYVVIKGQLWREITEQQAKKLDINMPSWAPVVERALPAVVVITTEAIVEQPSLEFPGLPAPFRFYMPLPPEKQRGQGSGFIINEEGYVITNQHVIEGAQKIKLKVGKDPKELDATVIGADKELDIALLKIKPNADEKIVWPYLPLGSSASLKLADNVLALGSPFGLVHSVNAGIVAALNRGGIRPSARDLFVELIQLQMPINPGNSGGPVLDTAGRVVGVNESILASGQAVAFCVPIDIIKQMIPQLKANGMIEKAFLGVEPTDLTPQYAKALGLSADDNGAVIMQVLPNTPAEKAGLKASDVILEINGKKVADSFNLRQRTAYAGVGTELDLKIYRKGSGNKIVKVKLEKKPGQDVASHAADKALSKDGIEINSVGLSVTDTPAHTQKELNLSANNAGALVVGVMRGSLASFSSIEPNDVIIEVNSTLITNAAQLKTIIDKAPSETALLILLRRGAAKRFVPIEKP